MLTIFQRIRSSVLPLVFVMWSLSGSAFAGEVPFPDLVDLKGNDAAEEASVGNGKWKLVMIWATDCHVCKAQKPEISAFHQAHKDIDAEVFGIALDGRANLGKVKQYMKDHKVAFPSFVGEFTVVAANYELNLREQLLGTPTYVLYNPTGELIAAQPGILRVSELEKFIAKHSEGNGRASD